MVGSEDWVYSMALGILNTLKAITWQYLRRLWNGAIFRPLRHHMTNYTLRKMWYRYRHVKIWIIGIEHKYDRQLLEYTWFWAMPLSIMAIVWFYHANVAAIMMRNISAPTDGLLPSQAKLAINSCPEGGRNLFVAPWTFERNVNVIRIVVNQFRLINREYSWQSCDMNTAQIIMNSLFYWARCG